MSNLSKVFVVLVCAVALIKLGVDVTVFAHSVDWKDKFVREVNYHYQTQQVKNAEIQDLNLQVENYKEYGNILVQKIQLLESENANKSYQLAELQRTFDQLKTTMEGMKESLGVYVSQLDVQMNLITEMTNKVEGYKNQIARMAAERSTAVQELQYARQEAEMLQKSLASLEEHHITLARDKQRLEETIKALADRGVDVAVTAPKKLLEGKVMAVSAEIGLVIVSIGKDDGAGEGQEFTVYRGGTFVAKIVIDRVDRKHSAGRVTVKREEPRVSDDVSNSIFVGAFKSNP